MRVRGEGESWSKIRKSVFCGRDSMMMWRVMGDGTCSGDRTMMGFRSLRRIKSTNRRTHKLGNGTSEAFPSPTLN